MTRMIKAVISLLGLAVVCYVTFFVPLGERTLYEHLRRIAGTEEAQELGREAEQAGERLGEHIEGQLERLPDGGKAEGPMPLGTVTTRDGGSDRGANP